MVRGLFLIYLLVVAFIFYFVFCLHLIADTLPAFVKDFFFHNVFTFLTFVYIIF